MTLTLSSHPDPTGRTDFDLRNSSLTVALADIEDLRRILRPDGQSQHAK
jgi:hypothetical protein